MRTQVVSFFIFFQELSSKKKKVKDLRPKMSKLASRRSWERFGLKQVKNETSLVTIIGDFWQPFFVGKNNGGPKGRQRKTTFSGGN